MSTESLSKRVELYLTPKENEAYQKYVESGKPSLSPATSADMLRLFLLGHTCEEISKLNPGFGLGIIVKARIEHKWDQHKEEHLDALLADVRRLVQQTQVESVRFVADAMAAFQKMAGERFQKYVQTGDISHLGDFKDMGFKQYKDLLEMLQKLTGQDTQKKVGGEITHRHVMQEAAVPAVRTDRPMKAQEADDLLKLIEGEVVQK